MLSVPLKHVNANHVCSSIELSIQCKIVTNHVCSGIQFSIHCKMVFHEVEASFPFILVSIETEISNIV